MLLNYIIMLFEILFVTNLQSHKKLTEKRKK